MTYQPFIDDPEHLGELEGQRFVVLRPGPLVTACHREVQNRLRKHLEGYPASYPARAHVTLAGFGAGTPLRSVQQIVSDWSAGVPPLELEVQDATSFPPPFQIAILRIVKTCALFNALQTLRRRGAERNLTLSMSTPVEAWVFHLSLAYCSKLRVDRWKDVARFLDAVDVPVASSIQESVEIVAFDDGEEHSGGVHRLSGEPRQCPSAGGAI